MRSILKQSALLMVAQGLSRVIGFFYTLYLARNLGVESFGLYSLALAYFYLVSTISEFGFNRYITREIALNSAKIGQLFCNISLLRLTITAVAFGILALVLYIFDQDKLRTCIVVLAILATLPLAIAQTIDAIFVALKRLQFSAISLIILSLTMSILGVFLVKSGFGITGAVTALIVGQTIYFLALLVFLIKQKVNLLAVIKSRLLVDVTRGAVPYGILGVIGLVSFKLDTIILSYVKGNFETGLYTAAYKFFETMAFVPGTLAIALFPVVAKMHQESVPELKKLFAKIFKTAVVVGISSAVLFYAIVPVIIQLFLPKYLASLEAVKILSLAIPFMFIHIPVNQILLSTEKYLKPLLILYTGLLIINIIDYLVLISWIGFRGAAWGTVISELMTFAVLTAFLQFRVFGQHSK